MQSENFDNDKSEPISQLAPLFTHHLRLTDGDSKPSIIFPSPKGTEVEVIRPDNDDIQKVELRQRLRVHYHLRITKHDIVNLLTIELK